MSSQRQIHTKVRTLKQPNIEILSLIVMGLQKKEICSLIGHTYKQHDHEMYVLRIAARCKPARDFAGLFRYFYKNYVLV